MGRPEEARNADVPGPTWIYACLVEHRAAAAVFLRDVRSEFAAPAAAHLEEAAALFERISKRLEAAQGHQEQIGHLEEAMGLERQAIAEIEQALAMQM
jgi:hypothetical protein